MPTDFFTDFTSSHVPIQPDISSASPPLTIFTRALVEPSKPPLLLLHGYPQTHIEFHKIVPSLKPHFSLILLDLRGYGASSTVSSSRNGSGYSKRLMAQDCVKVMAYHGYSKFSILGHDRGAGVAYRLALDAPDKVDRVVVVDILPTSSRYDGFSDQTSVLKGFHWPFLAQPAPFPETLIRGCDEGRYFLEYILASWSGFETLEGFDSTALEEYRRAFCTNERIHATCEDYRAGAFLDKAHDEEDFKNGNKISAPVLVVWGKKGRVTGRDGKTPLDIWKSFAADVMVVGLDCGHFIPEEDPKRFMDAVLEFCGLSSPK
ncbi:hypothetical protein TWF694_005234 [Orbilia ellipsospora]|uniref:AB hydrolase-1 domain-containing protein n=1 Tax=Orbilia ellipsospora TaxID=2528407 RepID=A0AAV9WTJ7_9PEZI